MRAPGTTPRTTPRPAATAAAALAVPTLLAACGDAVSLSGSGATFPRPLYDNWIIAYRDVDPDVRIPYSGGGSSTGIHDIVHGIVDFAGSDAAMTDEDLAAVRAAQGKQVLMLPVTAGGIVVVYNLPGVDGLRISREALAGIFLGEITRWDAPELRAHNPGAALPPTKIEVVRRAEGSGTTFALTGHLSAISPEWRARIGQVKDPNWPVGIGGRGNAGVASAVQNTPGALGYVELSFARSARVGVAALQNAAGRFVLPTIGSMKAALRDTPLPDDLRLFLTDPAGEEAWPLVTYTWLLVYDRYPRAELEALRPFLCWILTDGQELSAPSGYVPLPEEVTARVLERVDSIRPEPGAADAHSR